MREIERAMDGDRKILSKLGMRERERERGQDRERTKKKQSTRGERETLR